MAARVCRTVQGEATGLPARFHAGEVLTEVAFSCGSGQRNFGWRCRIQRTSCVRSAVFSMRWLTLIGVAVGMAWFAGIPGSGVSILVLAPSLPVALLWFVNSRENQGWHVSTLLGPPTSPSLPQ